MKTDDAGAENLVEFGSPPPGAWFDKTFDGFVVGATTRSTTALLYGILGTLICGAGAVFFSAFRDSDKTGAFAEVFIGLVFFVPGAVLWMHVLMYLFGRVIVTVDGHRGTVFIGMGMLGITRRFNWLDVSEVRLVRYRYFREMDVKKALVIDKDPEDRLPEVTRIIIEEKRRIRFGRWLHGRRFNFILRVLQKMLAERDSQ